MRCRTLGVGGLALAGAAAGRPIAAQEAPKSVRIGCLVASTPAASAHNIEAFRQKLRELGYVEGKTFVLELRYGEARAELFPGLARELVGLKVDVIVAGTDVWSEGGKREDPAMPSVVVD